MQLHLIGLEQSRSPQLIQKSNQQELFCYSPYGTSEIDIDNPGFNGERQDPVNQTFHLGNGYRSFSPLLMRFSCPDDLSPFGEGGINCYAYCEADPVNHTDPSGQIKILRNIRRRVSTAFHHLSPAPVSNAANTGEEVSSIAVNSAQINTQSAEAVPFSPSTTTYNLPPRQKRPATGPGSRENELLRKQLVAGNTPLGEAPPPGYSAFPAYEELQYEGLPQDNPPAYCRHSPEPEVSAAFEAINQGPASGMMGAEAGASAAIAPNRTRGILRTAATDTQTVRASTAQIQRQGRSVHFDAQQSRHNVPAWSENSSRRAPARGRPQPKPQRQPRSRFLEDDSDYR